MQSLLLHILHLHWSIFAVYDTVIELREFQIIHIFVGAHDSLRHSAMPLRLRTTFDSR